jgi:hypothetical protein
MNELEQLTEEIKKELPRLMELTDGCIIKTPHWNIFIQMYEKNKYDDYYIFGSSIFNDNYDKICSVANIYKEFSKETSIIGHPILLSDVLEWLKGINTEIHSINKYGLFHDRNWNGAKDLKCAWDLSKPYLKDQSQELIDYLHSLIK